jgi:hypothetical protein
MLPQPDEVNNRSMYCPFLYMYFSERSLFGLKTCWHDKWHWQEKRNHEKSILRSVCFIVHVCDGRIYFKDVKCHQQLCDNVIV